MRINIILLLIAASFITVKAQDYIETTYKEEATTELFYSVTLPNTNFGIKCHHGKKWGAYAHGRINLKNFNNYSTAYLGSVGVSFKVMHFLKPYIGIGASYQSIRILTTTPSFVSDDGGKSGNSFGGEIGLLFMLLDGLVFDVGYCHLIEPSVTLGVGFSF